MAQYWARLGIARSATDREIKRSFLTAYGHPWQPGDEEKRYKLRLAYELLQCAPARAFTEAWTGDDAMLQAAVRQHCRFDAFAVLGLLPSATLCEVQAAFDVLPKPHTDMQHLARQLATCFHVDRYRAWLAQGFVSTRHEGVAVTLVLTLKNATHSLGLLTDVSLWRRRS